MRPIWTRSARQTSSSAEAAERVRLLGPGDTRDALDLLAKRPVENLFVASRIATVGLDVARMGCTVWGLEEFGRLISLCHVGSNVVPVDADAAALDAFADRLGRRRGVAAIMGNADQVRGLWDQLNLEHSSSWGHPREARWHQPLMVIDSEPVGELDRRVRHITRDDFDAYFEAAVAMYTEEVGVSPLDSSGSYRRYVLSLIDQGRAFGIVDATGQVIFKSDVGSALGEVCQIQGVWMHPGLRGRGLSEPAMASVVRWCRSQWPVVSLYVNDFNVRARRLYESVGFRTIGELGTVLY